jgi:hypothetical protein
METLQTTNNRKRPFKKRKPLSEEHKNKISSLLLNKPKSDEHKENMRKPKENLKDKPKSDLHKENMKKPKARYRCPYEIDIILSSRLMAKFISDNYPENKQWFDYTADERKNFITTITGDN